MKSLTIFTIIGTVHILIGISLIGMIPNFDEAIKQLRPPVFWKDKDNFKNHCSKWPTKSILHYIERLLEAEFMCKTQSSLNNEICEKYILSVAKKGEVYFN